MWDNTNLSDVLEQLEEGHSHIRVHYMVNLFLLICLSYCYHWLWSA